MDSLLKKKIKILADFIIKNNKKLPVHLSEPDVKKEDIMNIKRELKGNNVAIGDSSEKFRKKLTIITKSKNIVLTSNGTCALYTALLTENINENNEVLVPSFNYMASTNAILACKSNPHFIDSSLLNLGIDYEKLDLYLKKISVFRNKKTINKLTNRHIKALMITHIFGHPDDLKKAVKISKKYQLVLIEDASEALGSYYKKKHLGTVGDYGVLSFNGNKIITSGGGGALIVKKKNKLNKIKKIINNGKVYDKYEFLHSQFGLNFNLPNLNSTLGLSQIKRLEKLIKNRRLLFEQYSKINNQLFEFIKEPSFGKSSYWLQSIKVKNKKHKKFILDYFYKRKIFARSSWKPNHLFNHLKQYPRMNLKNSNKLYNTIINVPSSLKVKNQIIKVIK